MADTAISGLTAASAFAGTEVFPVVQSGDKKGTITQVGTFVRALFTSTPATIAEGGTNSATAAAARAALGLAIGTDVQAQNANLAAIGGVTSAANKGIQFTGSGTAATYTLSAFALTFLDDADAATVRATLGIGSGTGDVVSTNNGSDFTNFATFRTNVGLAIGTNVQAYNANLTTYAGVAPSANVLTLLGAANFAAFRTSLGLGTSATLDTGTSGTKVALTDGANTWSSVQTFSATAALSAGATNTPAATPAANAVGYLGSPINTQNATYSTVMLDAGKTLYHTSGSAHTWTIDDTIAYPDGTIIGVSNENGGGNVTIAINNSATLRWGSSTGSRTFAQNGNATVQKKAAGLWRLTGDGIT